MLAVSVRAYHAAIILLDTIQKVGRDAKDTSAMILPADASPDLSPLFVTCCNDTCSFTWTGAEHINQVNGRSMNRALQEIRINIALGNFFLG